MGMFLVYAVFFILVYPLVSVVRNDYYKGSQKLAAFTLVVMLNWFGWYMLWSMRRGVVYFAK